MTRAWQPKDSRHVTAQFAGVYLAFLGVDNPPSIDVIRHWKHRGHVTRVGTDPQGHALYDLTTIVATAKRLGYINIDDLGVVACT